MSATLQSIAAKHTELYGTMKNFHEKNVIQINDTHPALVIPELMRILIDDAGMDWDEAWDITTRSVAYTNHTVLSEALERWPQSLVEFLLPRVWQIILEISRRWQKKVEDFYHDPKKTEKMAIVWGGQVRMANLCIAGGMAVNGVSGLHSEILKKDVFRDAYGMEPWKFRNVTNGIDHRRWLSEINPGLDGLIRDLTGGDDYLLHPQALKKLDDYADDASVLERLGAIKRANKAAFAAHAKKTRGVELNPDAIFDVQVKRLHEYKRQLLNVLHIIALYQKLQDDPNAITQPHTFLFGAKAAPGYAVAKRIIRLINSLADQIDHDPICRDKLQVVFPGELPGLPGGAADARQRGEPADLHRRQGGQRHRQHEVHDERRPDRWHPGRCQRGDARPAGGREHVPLWPAGRRGGAAEEGKAMCPSGCTTGTRCFTGAWTRCGPASGTVSGTTTCTSGCCSAPGQPRGRVLFAGGLPGILPGGKAHGGDLSGPDGLESHEPAQHRPQRRVRRRPGCGGVCRQHLARAPQVIRSEKNAENRKRLSRFRFRDPASRGAHDF